MYVYLEVFVMNFCSAAAILCFVFERYTFQYNKAAIYQVLAMSLSFRDIEMFAFTCLTLSWPAGRICPVGHEGVKKMYLRLNTWF